MKHLISSRTALFLCGMSLCFCASAQSYVTYNHDAAKMNQIMVQEIGAGGLTPAFKLNRGNHSGPIKKRAEQTPKQDIEE